MFSLNFQGGKWKIFPHLVSSWLICNNFESQLCFFFVCWWGAKLEVKVKNGTFLLTLWTEIRIVVNNLLYTFYLTLLLNRLKPLSIYTCSFMIPLVISMVANPQLNTNTLPTAEILSGKNARAFLVWVLNEIIQKKISWKLK